MINNHNAPSSEDILRKEHGHGQALTQLWQKTRCQPCQKKLSTNVSKQLCCLRGKQKNKNYGKIMTAVHEELKILT